MEKNFIPFEEAKALKELGFDEPCFGYYTLSHTGDNYTFHICGEFTTYRDNYINYVGEGLTNDELELNPSGRNDDCFTAPLWQQAFEFFREKYNLIGEIPHSYKFDQRSIISYHITINNKFGQIKVQLDEFTFDTYEEAQLECLRKLIELVK
jgi:hypothetical protein